MSEQPARRLLRMERTTGSSSFAHGANNRLVVFRAWSEQPARRLFAHGANNRLVVFRAWSEQPARRLSRMERTTGSSSFAHGANNRLALFRAWSEQQTRRLSRMERTTGSIVFRAWSEQPCGTDICQRLMV